jgi:hypothetical protein
MTAKPNYNCTVDDEPDKNCRAKNVGISSFLDGPFDTPKQDPKRGAHDLRLFEPGKAVSRCRILRSASVSRIVVFSKFDG